MKRSQISKLIKESLTNITSNQVEKAYQEAYEYETGDPMFISSFNYEDVEIETVMTIKGVVSNGEKIGDVKLLKMREGWRIGY